MIGNVPDMNAIIIIVIEIFSIVIVLLLLSSFISIMLIFNITVLRVLAYNVIEHNQTSIQTHPEYNCTHKSLSYVSKVFQARTTI